jgi:hypothetical protein
MNAQARNLALECKRYSESCLYTSTSFYIWLKFLRGLKLVLVTSSLVLGSLASFKLFTQDPDFAKVAAVFAFVAGLLPTIQEALKLDANITEAAQLAGEFKNLQDLFRRAALVSAYKPFAEFEADVKKLTERLEKARASSVTPPEFFFKRAQKKVNSGDYDFDVDQQAEEKARAPELPPAATTPPALPEPKPKT